MHIASAQPLHAIKCGVEKAGKAALIAVVLSTGISLAPPDLQLLQPARADDDAGMSASQKRSAANDRRKALLARARESALNRGELAGGDPTPAESTSSSGDAGSAGTLSVLFNVEPEKPQLKTESAVSATAKPELPKIPAPELPKSFMPESPMFNMPSKPMQPPPGPSMSSPKEVPKTESPVVPVPAPGPPGKQAATAPMPAAAPAPSTNSSAGSMQGFDWDKFTKDTSQQKPKANPFSSVEPEKKQTASSQDTKAGPAKQLQQAKEQGAPVDKRKSKRHGPPLFLVQLVITVGIIGALAAAVIKYDGMMANGAKLEKAIIQVAEKVQLPKSPAKDV